MSPSTVAAVLWVLGAMAGLLVLDRILLWMEARGWIYYRKNKPGRGASMYHLLEWNSAFDPTMRQVQEERVKEEIQEEESGEPPVPVEVDLASSDPRGQPYGPQVQGRNK